MAKLVRVNVIVSCDNINKDLTEEEFCDKFFDFLEANNWIAGGSVSEEEDDEDVRG